MNLFEFLSQPTPFQQEGGAASSAAISIQQAFDESTALEWSQFFQHPNSVALLREKLGDQPFSLPTEKLFTLHDDSNPEYAETSPVYWMLHDPSGAGVAFFETLFGQPDYTVKDFYEKKWVNVLLTVRSKAGVPEETNTSPLFYLCKHSGNPATVLKPLFVDYPLDPTTQQNLHALKGWRNRQREYESTLDSYLAEQRREARRVAAIVEDEYQNYGGGNTCQHQYDPNPSWIMAIKGATLQGFTSFASKQPIFIIQKQLVTTLLTLASLPTSRESALSHLTQSLAGQNVVRLLLNYRPEGDDSVRYNPFLQPALANHFTQLRTSVTRANLAHLQVFLNLARIPLIFELIQEAMRARIDLTSLKDILLSFFPGEGQLSISLLSQIIKHYGELGLIWIVQVLQRNLGNQVHGIALDADFFSSPYDKKRKSLYNFQTARDLSTEEHALLSSVVEALCAVTETEDGKEVSPLHWLFAMLGSQNPRARASALFIILLLQDDPTLLKMIAESRILSVIVAADTPAASTSSGQAQRTGEAQALEDEDDDMIVVSMPAADASPQEPISCDTLLSVMMQSEYGRAFLKVLLKAEPDCADQIVVNPLFEAYIQTLSFKEYHALMNRPKKLDHSPAAIKLDSLYYSLRLAKLTSQARQPETSFFGRRAILSEIENIRTVQQGLARLGKKGSLTPLSETKGSLPFAQASADMQTTSTEETDHSL